MKALVLCAGLGTRLGALVRDQPKPLLPIGGEPLLAHTLRYLAAYGFDDVAINLHHLPKRFIDAVGDGAAFGVRVTYSHEEKLLGTAGAVKRLESWLGREECVLVIYGDLLIDQDLHALVAAQRAKRATATLLLHRRARSNSHVRMDDDRRIVAFVERPGEVEQRRLVEGWVNSGVQVLAPRLLSHLAQGRPSDLPRDVYVPLLDTERIYGFPLAGYRCAIDSPERYAEAQAAFAEGRYRPPLPSAAAKDRR